jgi:hypothetical protein
MKGHAIIEKYEYADLKQQNGEIILISSHIKLSFS